MAREKAPDAAALQQLVGARLREFRDALTPAKTQQAVGEIIAPLTSSPQSRIAKLERGEGSAVLIYSLLRYYHEQGFDLNYLFDAEVGITYKPKDAYVYRGNVNALLQQVSEQLVEARASIVQCEETTERLALHYLGSEPIG